MIIFDKTIQGEEPTMEPQRPLVGITISIKPKNVSVLRQFDDSRTEHSQVSEFNTESDQEIRIYLEKLMTEATNFLESTLDIDSFSMLFSIENNNIQENK